MRFSIFGAAALALSTLLAAPATASADDGGDAAAEAPSDYQFGDRASLDRRTEEARLDLGIIGGAIAAARSDRMLYSRAFGMADREAGRAATMDTPFAMASVTKTLTATAIMMLVDEGRVSLDEPVNSYLGADKVRATYADESEITLGRVLSHEAGLPLFYRPLYADENTPDASFAELMRDYGYTVLPAGIRSEYSNLGYEILAEIIRRQSGMSYAQFMERRIFAPLGMGSALIADGRQRPQGAAQRYMIDGTIVPGVDTPHPGAANAYMSVNDLVRFGQFWLNAYHGRSKLLSASSARAMIGNGVEPVGEGAGRGLWAEIYPAETLYVGHGGSMAGAKARLAILPEKDLVIAVAINERNATAEAYLGEEMIRSFENASNLYWRAPVVPEALIGKWNGVIGGNSAIAPLTLDFTDSNAPKAWVAGEPVLVRGISGTGPYTVRLDGELPGAGFGVPHDLRILLVPHEEGLAGHVRLEPLPQSDRDNGSIGYWLKMVRG